MTYGTDYTVSGREITFATAPNGVLAIDRETPSTRLVQWNEGSVLTASNMSLQQVQELHLIEETEYKLAKFALAKDETFSYWYAQYLQIKNVADPTDDQDVVTKKWLLASAASFVPDCKKLLELCQAQAKISTDKAKESADKVTECDNKVTECQDVVDSIPKYVSLSKAQYDALVTKDDNTWYFIYA